MGEHRFGQVVSDLGEAFEVLEVVQSRGKFAVTFQPGYGDLPEVVGHVCEYVFDVRGLMLALEEVPHYCTASSMPDGLEVLARMGRHRGVDLVYTGQRFAELPRRLTATTDYFVLFGQREPGDGFPSRQLWRELRLPAAVGDLSHGTVRSP